MELENLQGAWKAFGRELERHNDLAIRDYRDHKLARARSSLAPIRWGQALQIAFGVAIAALGVAVWTRHRDFGALWWTGVMLHAYGVATIVSGGVLLGLLGGIDYAAPVVAIQKRLARVRRVHVVTGLALGLAWWLLWIVCAMAIFDVALHVDLYAVMPGVVWLNLAIGAVGLVLTVCVYGWARRAGRARLANAVDDSLAGSSLRRANAELAQIVAFEHD